MKTLRLLALALVIQGVPLFGQTEKTIEINDVGSGIELKIGDSVITFTNEDMSNYFIEKGVELASGGDYEGAIEQINLSFLYISDNYLAFYYRALANYYLENYIDAEVDFTKALTIKSDCYDCYNQRGIIYSKTDRFYLADADFMKAIELNPENGQAYLNAGINYLMKGENSKACEYIEIAKSKGQENAGQILIDYCQ